MFKETLIIGYLDKNGSSCRSVKALNLENETFKEILFPDACYENIENISKLKGVKPFELGILNQISVLSINIEIQNKWAHIFLNYLYNLINSSNVTKIILLSSIFPVDIPKTLSTDSFFETTFNAEQPFVFVSNQCTVSVTKYGTKANFKVSGAFVNYFCQIAIVKRLPLNILWVVGNKAKSGVPSSKDKSLENIETFHSRLREILSCDFNIDVSKDLELQWEEDNLLYH